MNLFLKIVLTLNVAVIVFTLFGYLASYIDPTVFSLPQTIGLIMPMLLVLNLLFAGFWVCLRRRQFWYSALALLIGVGQITRLVGFHFNQSDQTGEVSICSFNAQNYNALDNVDTLLKQSVLPHELDVLCLQEISQEHVKGIKKTSGLKHHFYHQGKFILAKFPITKTGKLQFDNSVNGCVWTDLDLGERTIRVYNVHLRSNSVKHDDLDIFGSDGSTNSTTIRNLPSVLNRYRLASETRTLQAKTLLDHIAQCGHPVIVAGDFNDSPFSYTYQQFRSRLQDQFKTHGLGIGATFAGSVPGLKIDYIFADDNFESLNHRIVRTKISDHFPVISSLNLKP